MNALSSAIITGFEARSEIGPASKRRRWKTIVAALLLGSLGAIGFNVYVFSHIPQRTPSYGIADVWQIYNERQQFDLRRSQVEW